jgi:exodeoxyribonuclease-1
MTETFFFYDLETSGLSARDDRIMQFAGQRTDMKFNPIGEPVNILVRLSDDVLPSPEALLVTGITPQQTVADGYSEAEFAKILVDEIFTPSTIAVGFNSIRFDDEFVRHFLWRNFYDPYEWSWKDSRSRWDILDVVRMTRALRPDGMIWPVDDKGNPTNRLELLTKENGVDHYKAHDALSDVMATIAVAKLISEKQPQLFQYLLKLRSKKEVMNLVNLDEKKPFVYTSGRYETEHQKTTVAFPLTSGKNGNVVVYDLRYDPAPFIGLSTKELTDRLYASWEERQKDNFVKLPVKELQYNRAPAVAPLGVLEQGGGWERIHLDAATIDAHKKALLAAPHFAENIRALFEKKKDYPVSADPEAQLYDGFVNDRDRVRIESVRNATERELVDFHPSFDDERLAPLLLHYKARNYPRSLSEDEVVQWESWRSERLRTRLPAFLKSLQSAFSRSDDAQRFVIEELQLWAESIMPVDEA